MPEPGLPPGFVQEQRAEAFLTEVTISGQRGGDAQFAHRGHRNAVDEAIALVGPGFV